MKKNFKVNKVNLLEKQINVNAGKGVAVIENHELSNALVHYGSEIAQKLGINLHDISIDSSGKVIITNQALVTNISKNGVAEMGNICCAGCGCGSSDIGNAVLPSNR